MSLYLHIGATKLKVNLTITKDEVDEEPEEFTVVLAEPQNTAPNTVGKLGDIDEAIVTILDEDDRELKHHTLFRFCNTSFMIPGTEVYIKDFSYTEDNDTVVVQVKLGRDGDISNEEPVNVIIQPTRLNDAPDDLQTPIEEEIVFKPGNI